ncbi:hypothetical protein OAN22_02710 [Alphaproteobacteria bacterium]|nr:hypothetical protein [Alphaproteobacteria bacterium]
MLDLEHNFPVEIQLHHVCMINTKNSCGHTIYERYRDLEAKKEAGKKLTQEEELEMGELNITTKHLYQNGCRNYGLKCAHKSATPDIDRHQYQLSDWALGKMTHPDNPTKTTNKKIYQRRLKRLLFSAQEADMEKIRIFADLGPTEEIDRAHLFKVFFKEKVKK